MTFKYSGDLIKPIEPPVIGILMTDAQISEDVRAIVIEEHARRMDLLFDAHEIQRGNWMALCYAMAKAHIPGFRMAKARSGRAKKWGEYDRAMLVLAVEETGLKKRAAAKLLAKQEPWKSLVKATRGFETLKDEYTRADARWVAIAKAARAFDALSEEEKESARNLSVGY
jgi:hypothetical protein